MARPKGAKNKVKGGFSYIEIAKELGCTTQNVGQIERRALKKIREGVIVALQKRNWLKGNETREDIDRIVNAIFDLNR